MGKRIVVGYMKGRVHGLLMEDLLQKEGIPAFSEHGIVMSQITESQPCRIFVDSVMMKYELIPVLEHILGEDVFHEGIAELKQILSESSD
jgi:hypothetical protein